MRASGIEVWLDESELQGGDAWDQKIRNQIRECALFVPVISATTNGRREGYFRREWKLAVDRTHDMDESLPFLLPVVIDDTSDADAFVPEKFRHVQWIRVPGGAVPKGLCDRLKALLDGGPPTPSKSPFSQRSPVSGGSRAPLGEPVPRPRGRAWLAVTAGVLVLAVLLVFGRAYLRESRARPLTDKDTIVLAEFENRTGDAVFDGTLRQGLSAQLAQSPFLSLISDQQIAQTLELMTQPRGAPLTPDLAREIGRRTGSVATIEGSISPLGARYVLGLRAVACLDGSLLFEQQVTASGKEQVLEALAKIATDLRTRLGESLSSIQRYNAPPQTVTTPSLEALQAYSLGVQRMEIDNDYAAAVPFFEKATALDPKFAMAYLDLGNCYYPLSELGKAAESIRKAYELRERTSEREKLCIASAYELTATGNLESARTSTELWTQAFPRDYEPAVILWLICAGKGDYERSHAAAEQAVRLSPANTNNVVALAYADQWVGRIDDEKAVCQGARDRKLISPWMPVLLYTAAFLEHDAPAMERAAADPIAKPIEDILLFLESETAATAGQFEKCRILTNQAVEAASRGGIGEVAGEYLAHAAVREALVGNFKKAEGYAEDALQHSRGKHVEGFAGIALGLAGVNDRARLMATELGEGYPQDTIVRYDYLPMIHAAIAIRAKHSVHAADVLASSSAYELAHTNASFSFALYPAYLRGLAYLETNRGPAAEKEFQKVIDHPGVVGNELIGSLAHLGLGRSLALRSEVIKAKAAYKDFLNLWAGADPETPILKEARTELADLGP